MQWLRFFLGTPRRLVATVAFVGLVVVVVKPGLLRLAVERLLTEVSPLMEPVITLLIVIVGIRLIFFGRK